MADKNIYNYYNPNRFIKKIIFDELIVYNDSDNVVYILLTVKDLSTLLNNLKLAFGGGMNEAKAEFDVALKYLQTKQIYLMQLDRKETYKIDHPKNKKITIIFKSGYKYFFKGDYQYGSGTLTILNTNFSIDVDMYLENFPKFLDKLVSFEFKDVGGKVYFTPEDKYERIFYKNMSDTDLFSEKVDENNMINRFCELKNKYDIVFAQPKLFDTNYISIGTNNFFNVSLRSNIHSFTCIVDTGAHIINLTKSTHDNIERDTYRPESIIDNKIASATYLAKFYHKKECFLEYRINEINLLGLNFLKEYFIIIKENKLYIYENEKEYLEEIVNHDISNGCYDLKDNYVAILTQRFV